MMVKDVFIKGTVFDLEEAVKPMSEMRKLNRYRYGHPWKWAVSARRVHEVEMATFPPNKIEITHSGIRPMRFVLINSKGQERSWVLGSIDILTLTFKGEEG